MAVVTQNSEGRAALVKPEMDVNMALSATEFCYPIHLLSSAEQERMSLFYLAGVDVLAKSGLLDDAWQLMQRGLNLGEPERSPEHYVRGVWRPEYETLSHLLAGRDEEIMGSAGYLFGHACIQHGKLAKGQGDYAQAQSSLLRVAAVGDDGCGALQTASAQRELAQNIMARLAANHWQSENGETAEGLLRDAAACAFLAAELTSRDYGDGAGESRFLYRAAGATLGQVLHMLAIHACAGNEDESLKHMHAAGRCFAEVEQNFLNSYDSSYLARENDGSLPPERRMMALTPGAQYVLYLLDRAALLPNERKDCLEQAWLRAEHNLAAARRIWPRPSGAEEPASFHEGLAQAMRGLVGAAAGFESSAGQDWQQGLAALEDFGRHDILHSFELRERYQRYQSNMLDCSWERGHSCPPDTSAEKV